MSGGTKGVTCNNVEEEDTAAKENSEDDDDEVEEGDGVKEINSGESKCECEGEESNDGEITNKTGLGTRGMGCEEKRELNKIGGEDVGSEGEYTRERGEDKNGKGEEEETKLDGYVGVGA